jgi:hypothetical protein
MNSLIHTKGTRNLGHYSRREYEGPAITNYGNNYMKSKNTIEMRGSNKYMYLHI